MIKSGKAWRVIFVIAVAVAFVLIVLALLSRRHSETSPVPRSARDLLKDLRVEEPERGSEYDRDEQFGGWRDADGDCLNTRDEVLKRDSITATNVGCDIEDGEWLSLYDGQIIASAAQLEIDHLVALKEAWVSGAARWTGERRNAFVNDLGYAGSLIAVSIKSHDPKGALDPSEWLPKEGVCEFVERWVAIKWRWGLSVDSREQQALRKLLSGDCGSKPLDVDLYNF